MGADTTQNGTEPAAYQSLYRRFRPQRFDTVLGQPQVSLALRNVVREGRVGHAYLFSGPRGTGKTSTARILAKALNCAAPEDGEPCGRCESCVEIANGSSLDVHELDAASNNGVDAMRDLVSRAALGTPGRWKVYIVDEVHMLSAAASNALLKTLEEPPGHVVFVLATTEAQKVLPTIRSRTQHFEFRLLSPEILSGLLRQVRDSADLVVEDDAVDAAVRRGRGSARDALSALDQLSAGGVVGDDFEVLAELSDALADRDAGRALTAVARACEGGRDATRVAAELADYLRQGFLAAVAAELVSVSGAERAHVEEVARRMGLPALVRCLEELGRAQVEMRDIPDPRVHFEVTLIRLSHPEADDSPSALLERLERVERALAELGAHPGSAPPPRTLDPPAPPSGGVPPTRVSPAPGAGDASGASGSASRDDRTKPSGNRTADADQATSSTPSARAHATAVEQPSEEPNGAPAGSAGGPELARRTLGAIRRATAAPARASNAPVAPPSASTSGAGPSGPPRAPETGAVPVSSVSTSVGGGPTRDELVQVWGDGLLASLPNRARARFRVGRFLAIDGGAAVFALPSETHRRYCEDVRVDVEQALAARFGTAVPLRLVVDDDVDDNTRPDSAGAPPSRAKRATTGSQARRGDAAPDVPTSPGNAGDDDMVDLLDPEVLAAETEPAGAALSPEERLKQAFPGAQEV